MYDIIEKDNGPERALLVGVDLQIDNDFERAMEELSNLTEACNMQVAAVILQNMSNPNPATYVGSGKVLEIAETAERLDCSYVIFENDLSPAQLKNIQKEVNAAVMDRTNLILEIFTRRAGTREARLQVESAKLQYMLPRLVGMREQLGRQGGASGSMSNKGSGEKQLELDRRRIEKRIAELRRELDAIEHDRNVQRSRRSESLMPSVALVGYTNAGKSTLMNQLLNYTGGQEEKLVMAKDMLFATLDTTIRRIALGNGQDFLLSDTVGFVSHLPHGLVKAFRSTLDEVRYADLLVEVVDASDPEYRNQMQVTQETLLELGAEKIPCIHVMNKADRLEWAEGELPRVEGDRIYMSAKSGVGIEELLKMIKAQVYADSEEVEFLFPYNRGDAVSDLNVNANVLECDYRAEGVWMKAIVRPEQAGKYRAFRVDPR